MVNNLPVLLGIVFKEDKNINLEENEVSNLEILNQICLAVLKLVQTYYNDLSFNKIKFLLLIDIFLRKWKIFPIIQYYAKNNENKKTFNLYI